MNETTLTKNELEMILKRRVDEFNKFFENMDKLEYNPNGDYSVDARNMRMSIDKLLSYLEGVGNIASVIWTNWHFVINGYREENKNA